MAEIIGAPAAAAMVKTIFVYPIKSCRGISVSQAPITSTGISQLFPFNSWNGILCFLSVLLVMEGKGCLLEIKIVASKWREN